MLRCPRSHTISTKLAPATKAANLTECWAGHGIKACQHTSPKIGAAPQRERSFEDRSVACETSACKAFCDNCHGFRSNCPSVVARPVEATPPRCGPAIKTRFALRKTRLARGSLKKTDPRVGERTSPRSVPAIQNVLCSNENASGATHPQ